MKSFWEIITLETNWRICLECFQLNKLYHNSRIKIILFLFAQIKSRHWYREMVKNTVIFCSRWFERKIRGETKIKRKSENLRYPCIFDLRSYIWSVDTVLLHSVIAFTRGCGTRVNKHYLQMRTESTM